MMSNAGKPNDFINLTDSDKDLTMFTISKLTLTNETDSKMVYMTSKLKRKVITGKKNTRSRSDFTIHNYFSRSQRAV